MLKWVSLLALVAFSSSAFLDKAADKEILAFDLDGNDHTESRKAEGNLVELTDAEDGFLVILDYGRDILMIKNTTSETCFFARLEHVPIAPNETIPIMVQEVTIGIESMNVEQDTDVVLLTEGEKIPFGYLMLTTDVSMTTECRSRSAYWLDKVGATRNRRRCNWRCRLRLVVIGIVIGVAISG